MFKLKENGTKVSTEIIAGATTFFTMAYIIIVNPTILSEAGMEWGAVFLATIISAAIAPFIMGLFANVRTRLLGHGPQRVLRLHSVLRLEVHMAAGSFDVFICGVINILITSQRYVSR